MKLANCKCKSREFVPLEKNDLPEICYVRNKTTPSAEHFVIAKNDVGIIFVDMTKEVMYISYEDLMDGWEFAIVNPLVFGKTWNLCRKKTKTPKTNC